MTNNSLRISLFLVKNRVLFNTANEQRAHFALFPSTKFLGYRVCHSNLRLYERKLKRKFKLECLSVFGTDVDDVKLILSNQNTYLRKLNDTKRRQFCTLYMRALEDLLAGEEELRGILLTKIHLPMIMDQIRIHWRCTGDIQRDEEIDQLLKQHADVLRKKLSEMFFNTPVPPLDFVEDRQHLYEQELNKLLEIADYGKQYRAVSRVSAILGSSRDTGIKSTDPNDPTVPKEQVPPRWLENWRKRTKATKQNESNEKTGGEGVILEENRKE